MNPVHITYLFLLRFILILSFYLRTDILSDQLPSGFSIKVLYAFIIFLHACCRPYSSDPSWFDRPNVIWWRVKNVGLPFMQFSQASHHFIFLSSKYSSKEPVLKHAQSMYQYIWKWNNYITASKEDNPLLNSLLDFLKCKDVRVAIK